MMEDFGASCTAVLSFTDALGLYAFDDTFGPLTDAFDLSIDFASESAWPSLKEWTSPPELVELPEDLETMMKEKKPEPRVAQRPPQKRTTRVKRPRAQRREPAQKQPRKRAKTEILNLQSQVAELESQLMKLQSATAVEIKSETLANPQQASHSDSLSLTSESVPWLQLAAGELQKLKEAQELNASLKSALASEIQVREAFETELQTTTQLQTENSDLLDDESSPTSSIDLLQEADCSSSSLGQIRRILVDLEKLYSDADLGIEEEGDGAPREAAQRFELLDTEFTLERIV